MGLHRLVEERRVIDEKIARIVSGQDSGLDYVSSFFLEHNDLWPTSEIVHLFRGLNRAAQQKDKVERPYMGFLEWEYQRREGVTDVVRSTAKKSSDRKSKLHVGMIDRIGFSRESPNITFTLDFGALKPGFGPAWEYDTAFSIGASGVRHMETVPEGYLFRRSDDSPVRGEPMFAILTEDKLMRILTRPQRTAFTNVVDEYTTKQTSRLL